MLWSDCPGVGVVRLQQLERLPGGLAGAWAASPEALAHLTGWPTSLLAAIAAYRERWGDDPLPRLGRLRRGGRGLLLPGDRRWPAALQTLARPPLWLHWQGRGSLWPLLARRQAVAVVGTRHPSEHGLLMAHRLGAHLAAQGWPVVSGLAEGIDAAAHQGCLSRSGSPVAVLGTPLQRVYPRHHGPLQAEVGRRGLLVSEWPAGAPVRPGHFASRNRLLVALAAAVVVVECPPESGALHSAELAWQLGLPLWAVPGDAARRTALGSNRLLARGATPLLEPGDLTDQLGPGPLTDRGWRRATPAPAALEPGGPAARVLAALGEGAGLEDLGQALALEAPVLSSALLQLELAGLVRPEPGLRWRPC
ncbi:DNA-protecting protein DprA [Synechococcus sp. CBW1004]|nr:DNA-protecting protein DprA [Synechococcus sp. CBW1004]